MGDVLFEAKHIVKKFGPTVALNDVDLTIKRGEIRGFIGENGSGKSTMSAIMCGIHKLTSGEMYFNGEKREPKSMIDALNHGIGICIQENGTVADISVAENIFLGELSLFSGYNFFNHIYDYPVFFSDNFSLDISDYKKKLSEFVETSDRLHKELNELTKQDRKDTLAKIHQNFKEAEEFVHQFLNINIAKLKENKKSILEKENNEFKTKKVEICKVFKEDKAQINEKYNAELKENSRDKYLIELDRKDFIKKRTIIFTNDLNELTNRINKIENDLDNDIKNLKKLSKKYLFLVKNGHDFKNETKYKIFKKTLDILFKPFVNKSKLFEFSNIALKKSNLDFISSDTKMNRYNMQQRKLVEMAKVLNKDPSIFIVDETTNALTEDGRRLIYSKIDQLKNENRAVLFISHDLDEIMSVCDVITVLRDGKIIGEVKKANYDPVIIKKMMIGRDMDLKFYRQDYVQEDFGKVALKLENGNTKNLHNINLELHKGEILGIGGLSDCGMHELGKVLFGAAELKKGAVKTGENLDVIITSERAAMKHNIGYVSKDRDFEALSLKDSILTNVTLASLNKIKRANFLVLKSDEKKLVNEQIQNLSIKCQNSEQVVSALSGGNKQKVSLAKWLANGSDILILDCPTRGVDIGVKQFIYDLLYKMKKQGKAILMISEELPELIGMSDRILIMKNGEFTKEFLRDKNLKQEDIVDYMI